MEIKIAKPPIYDSACSAFKINPETVLFTYGDTIYNPGGVNLSDDLIKHEEVHAEQQNHNDEEAALWWGKYLRDPEFRLKQEVEAYGKQYWYICRYKTSNKQTQFTILKRFAQILSGPLYGECVGLLRAMQLIKEQSYAYNSQIHKNV